MNKNGGAEFLEQDATIERLANNQPTSSVARVNRTDPHGLRAFPILPNFCLFLSRYRPAERFPKKRSRKSTHLTPQFHADCIHV